MMSGLLSAGAVVAATNKFRSEVYMRGHGEQYRKCHPRTALNDSFLQYRGKEESNRHFTCTYIYYGTLWNLYLLQFQAFNYIQLKIEQMK